MCAYTFRIDLLFLPTTYFILTLVIQFGILVYNPVGCLCMRSAVGAQRVKHKTEVKVKVWVPVVPEDRAL